MEYLFAEFHLAFLRCLRRRYCYVVLLIQTNSERRHQGFSFITAYAATEEKVFEVNPLNSYSSFTFHHVLRISVQIYYHRWHRLVVLFWSYLFPMASLADWSFSIRYSNEQLLHVIPRALFIKNGLSFQSTTWFADNFEFPHLLTPNVSSCDIYSF